ncbi:MAG: hypothetical protein GWO02_03030 [Gammaproteobacteria bacterium]|nr:hypothetical protein [Gammaproteobacteria bacterium]
MIGLGDQSLLVHGDRRVHVALLLELEAALVVVIGRAQLGLLQARLELDVVGVLVVGAAVLEHGLEPFILRGVGLGLVHR